MEEKYEESSCGDKEGASQEDLQTPASTSRKRRNKSCDTRSVLSRESYWLDLLIFLTFFNN
jgi:hypothetical protein